MGFAVAGPKFLHYENGPSIPMRLDIDKYYGRISADPTPLNMFKIYAMAKLFKLFAGNSPASGRDEPKP
jgi:hypothetical protein